VTNRESNDTRLSTDALGRSSSSTNPLGQTSQLSYDPAGRITTVTNTAGVQIERYCYDSQGRVISRTDTLNKSDTFE
jgi:YD repeat-containing protein